MDAKILNLLTVIKENCELPDIVKNEVNELLAGGYLDPLQAYANMWCKKLFHCSVYPAISRDSDETFSRYFENTKTTCLYIGVPEDLSEEEGKRKVLDALVRPLFEDTIDTKDVALSTSILCRVLWDGHEQQTRNEKAAYELFKMVKDLTIVEIDKELKNAMLEQIKKILGWCQSIPRWKTGHHTSTFTNKEAVMDETLKNFLLSVRKELSENNRKILDRMLISDEEQIARLKLIAESWLGALDRDVAVSVLLDSGDNVTMFDADNDDSHYEFHIPRAMSFNDAEQEILYNILLASVFDISDPESSEHWQKCRIRDVAALLLKLERNI